MTDTPTVRVIPGVPEPAGAPSNNSKRRRKGGQKAPASPAPTTTTGILDAASAALIEQAPATPDARLRALAPELVASSDGLATPAPEGPSRKSAVVDLIHKRQKMLGKKITRIQNYAIGDVTKLNEDQQRTLKTLPGLEAVHKELEDVRHAVEAQELEQAGGVAAAHQQKIDDAVAQAQAAAAARFIEILSLIRLRTLMADGFMPSLPSGLSEAEGLSLVAAIEALMGENLEQKAALTHGFLRGEGEHQDVPFARLQEIARDHMYAQAQLAATEPTPDVVQTGIAIVDSAPEPVLEVPAVSGHNIPATSPGGFKFISESELDDGAASSAPPGQELEPEVVITETLEATDDGVVVVETLELAIPAEEPSTLDWADDDTSGLPSIAGLQAEFGTSDAGTPVDPLAPVLEADEAPVLGSDAPLDDADGFTRTRGRGRGGRGGGRGGERGGRGGDRGGFRGGRGGFRGGDRGGERGGFRGGYRGGGRGGEPGADGERGGHRGGRGGEPGADGERGGHRGGRGGEHGADGDRGGHRGGGRGGEPGLGAERGGYRGGGRGGEPGLGGERGGHRGGGRGGEPGPGGERGGFRGGDRGGFRGGDRGAYRGGERGGYQSRADGDWRSGDRGRGRGQARGAAPPTSAA